MNFVYVRDKSDDRSIWTSVVNDDEYRIDALNGGIVLDIGMHTGSFCARAYVAGSREIYGFEVDTENFRLAQANVSSMAQVYNVAIVRSDARKDDVLHYSGHIPMEHELNTGVGTVFADEGPIVATIPFDEILRQLEREVRLVKLDTEGSEYPILLTSQRLGQVVEYVGEWHGNQLHHLLKMGLGPIGLPRLCKHFADNGFEMRCYARDEDMPEPVVGYFRAVRRDKLSASDPWHIGDDRTLVCASDS